jgi:hypothetical protein
MGVDPDSPRKKTFKKDRPMTTPKPITVKYTEEQYDLVCGLVAAEHERATRTAQQAEAVRTGLQSVATALQEARPADNPADKPDKARKAVAK